MLRWAITSPISFHDNVGHHLGEARYAYDPRDPMKEWSFSDDTDRVHLSFRPVGIERGGTNFVVLRMDLLKAYGFFTGRVRLDDGRWVEVREADRLFGSAEVVLNHW